MPNDTEESGQMTARKVVSRRQLLRTGGGFTVATMGFPVVSGVVGAQSGDGEDEEEDDVFTNGVLSDSTPDFGNSDYVGLYLLIEDPHNNPDLSGVKSCDVIEDSDRVAAYNATISEKVDVGAQAESKETTIYVAAKESIVTTGKQFVINSQTDCSSEYLSAKLEQVGSSSIETAAANETGEVTGDTTTTSSPGFSILASVLGISAAGVSLLARGCSRSLGKGP